MHLTAFQMGSDERDVGSVLEKGGANHYRGSPLRQKDEPRQKLYFVQYGMCLLYDTKPNVPQLYPAIVYKKTSKNIKG